MLLPKKLTPESAINLVHTSSPVYKSDLRVVDLNVKKLAKEFHNTKVYDVMRNELDPRYLAGSEKERLKKFRKAIKTADWLLPIYGGTGCPDIIRHLNDDDLADLRRQHPIVNGFSDTTFLINYLYFKLKLITFHYYNVSGLFLDKNSKLFFEILTGQKDSFSFLEKNYRWLSSDEPEEDIKGIAIGGNFETFRDLLDICEIKPRSWRDYILFVEDIDMDSEDLHRLIISLDQRGVFRGIRALVIGKMDEEDYASKIKKFNLIFGKRDNHKSFDHYIQYLLSETLAEREKENDPLYILKIENFGHGGPLNPIIIPIGGQVVIQPNKKIKFIGPFVESDISDKPEEKEEVKEAIKELTKEIKNPQ
jgi:muramoyltetrapeptide carboxypeptidase LdcA involved in peptidoglycan recycling